MPLLSTPWGGAVAWKGGEVCSPCLRLPMYAQRRHNIMYCRWQYSFLWLKWYLLNLLTKLGSGSYRSGKGLVTKTTFILVRVILHSYRMQCNANEQPNALKKPIEAISFNEFVQTDNKQNKRCHIGSIPKIFYWSLRPRSWLLIGSDFNLAKSSGSCQDRCTKRPHITCITACIDEV